jgi:hypothetical protein
MMSILSTPIPIRRALAALAGAGALALGGLPAAAQTPAPVKPAAKPAPAKPAAAAAASEAGKTLGMGEGGAAAGGPTRPGLMTRDELRQCLNDEEQIRKRLEALEQARKPMDAEKQALAEEQAKAKAEREAMEQRQKQVSEQLNVKFRAYADRVQGLNARVEKFNANTPSNPTVAERERRAMNDERAALEKERPALESERAAAVQMLEAEVKAYNERLGGIDQRVQDWNRRNARLNDDTEQLEAERKDWVKTCANRRYREEDEIAIKAGK